LLWLFNVAALVTRGDAWLGLLYFMIFLIPFSSVTYLWVRGRGKASAATASSVEKWGSVLFALQGVALACWMFDLATTFYAIDIARVATEVNPLGWPLGALGAFAYYGPTVILTYVLLFRIKQKVSLYAAIPMTAVMLLMGSMNLSAGIGNYQFFITTASLAGNIRFNLLAIVVAVDVVYAVVLAKLGNLPFLGSSRKLDAAAKNSS
jgi:hypothetical protein